MIVRCKDCHVWYDNDYRQAVCPHKYFSELAKSYITEDPPPAPAPDPPPIAVAFTQIDEPPQSRRGLRIVRFLIALSLIMLVFGLGYEWFSENYKLEIQIIQIK